MTVEETGEEEEKGKEPGPAEKRATAHRKKEFELQTCT